MNEVFVSIIVDREERPDLDEQFLSVSQMLSGTGGWPLTIIMTPDGKPFYAATYLPRDSAYGRLGMRELVPKVRDLWKTRHADVVHSAEMIAAWRREARRAAVWGLLAECQRRGPCNEGHRRHVRRYKRWFWIGAKVSQAVHLFLSSSLLAEKWRTADAPYG